MQVGSKPKAAEQLPAEFTSAAIRAILDERKATGDGVVAGSYELQVEWEDPGGAGRRIWLPRALLMSDGVTEGMVHEFEDNLLEHSAKATEEATAQFNSLVHADVLERATRTGQDPSVRVRDLAHALESIGLTDSATERLLFELDTNKNGMVSRDEFCRGYAHWKHAIKSVLG